MPRQEDKKQYPQMRIVRFVIIVNGFEPLTIITKRSILDVVAVLDPPLVSAVCDIRRYVSLPNRCTTL